MIRFITLNICVFIITTALVSCEKKMRILKIVDLPDYPSGSGMTLIKNHIFLIGDDAKHITILDTALKVVDTIRLIDGDEKRLPKVTKPDLEAAATIYIDNKPYGLFLGSGSLSPYRNYGYLVNPGNKKIVKFNLENFYSKIKSLGINEVNIEGACGIPGGIVLVNRGSNGYRKNQLIFTNRDFITNPSKAFSRIAKVGSNTDSISFSGVSGLDYTRKNDRLWLSVSTENTSNAIDDGEIGKSYVWMINDISSRKRLSAINPSKIFDLEVLDERFKGEKIESVCVLAQDKHSAELILVSDNDKGASRLFKVILTY